MAKKIVYEISPRTVTLTGREVALLYRALEKERTRIVGKIGYVRQYEDPPLPKEYEEISELMQKLTVYHFENQDE